MTTESLLISTDQKMLLPSRHRVDFKVPGGVNLALFFALAFAASTHLVFGQLPMNGTEYADKIEGSIINGFDLLPHKKFSYEVTISNKNEPERHFQATTVSILNNRTWRMDSRQPNDTQSVVGRNGELYFAALKPVGKEEYRETMIGYDPMMIKANRDLYLEANKLTYWPTTVGMVTLLDVLRMEGFEITQLEQFKTVEGRAAERIHYENKKVLQQQGLVQHGEIVLLPEYGYLVESFRIWFGPRSDEVEPKLSGQFAYEQVGEKLVLSSAVTISDSTKYRLFNLKVEDPVREWAYYRPESIGIPSPSNPNWVRYAWWMIGLVFVAGAFYFFRRMTKKA